VFKPPYSTARGSLKREAETCTSVFRSRRGQCRPQPPQIHNSISLRPQALRSRSALAEPRPIVRNFICNAGAIQYKLIAYPTLIRALSLFLFSCFRPFYKRPPSRPDTSECSQPPPSWHLATTTNLLRALHRGYLLRQRRKRCNSHSQLYLTTRATTSNQRPQ
jgi:hypothetical protein